MADGPDIRHRIDSVRSPRAAASEARQGEPEAAPGAIQLDCLQRILGARRPVSALPADQRLESVAVDMDRRLEKHLCNAAHIHAQDSDAKNLPAAKRNCELRRKGNMEPKNSRFMEPPVKEAPAASLQEVRAQVPEWQVAAWWAQVPAWWAPASDLLPESLAWMAQARSPRRWPWQLGVLFAPTRVGFSGCRLRRAARERQLQRPRLPFQQRSLTCWPRRARH